MIQQAVILCGGKGTRLGERTQDFPKPLLKVGKRPLLDHSIELLADQGITHFILAAGFRGDLIEEHFVENPVPGCKIDVVIEPEPLGTSGCLHLLAPELDENFLLVYGDIFLDFDPSALMEQHLATGAMATLLARQSDHPWDSDLIDADDTGRVSALLARAHRKDGKHYRNIGNAAFYALGKSLLEHIPQGTKSDFCKDVFPTALKAGAELRIHWLDSAGYVKDMGTPDRLGVVEAYLARRELITEARSNPGPIDTVFLDRDGTLNEERGLITSADELELIPGAAEAVALLNDAGIRCFLTTNQPVIARGLCGEKELAEIHAKLLSQIHRAGGRIERIYYSPYHPETHHNEGVPELRRASDCRKPGIGMIMKAVVDYDVDLSRAAIIGDTAADIQAGKNAGIRTALVRNTHLRDELQPDLCADTILEAVRSITNGALERASVAA